MRTEKRHLSDINLDDYKYPLFINGERYLLNRNPFQYAEEAVQTYWKDKVFEKSCELAYTYATNGVCKRGDELWQLATKELSSHFLAQPNFFDYFQSDGGDMIPEVKEITLFPDVEKEEEREVS